MTRIFLSIALSIIFSSSFCQDLAPRKAFTSIGTGIFIPVREGFTKNIITMLLVAIS